MRAMARVLGIDVGTAIVGWAVMEKDPYAKNSLGLIDFGAVTTKAGLPMPKRLAMIYSGLDELIKLHKPDVMAVESLFYANNQKTVMTVSQGRGVILLVAQHNGLEVFDYTPLQVKMAVTGYGKADKLQVQKMVKSILGLETIPKPDDAADAIAICIGHIGSTNQLLKGLKG